MSRQPSYGRRFRILCGSSGIAGVLLLATSFAINSAPPPATGGADLVRFGQQHYAAILWGGWLQAVAPVLIVLFAFALVHLAGAKDRLDGWMTFFGATVLMAVSMIEVTFYFSALNLEPAHMPATSLRLIAAVQHLYFIIGAPALFFPLGIVLLRSTILPCAFGYSALLLGAIFSALGIAYLLRLTLPASVTAFGGLQALWWMAAAISLVVRDGSDIESSDSERLASGAIDENLGNPR